jgi:NAD(P)H-dependent flavin oxidoreductase YrpB (nitropropane dioxygenase family)
MAAAMVLGAQGVWTGSVWLTSAESELDPVVRDKLVAASSEQTARTRCITGKPARHLVTPYTEAWDAPDTPDPLPMPLQTMATTAALTRISRALQAGSDGARELVTSPAGQAIGLITQVRGCRQIVQEFRESFADALVQIADGGI